MSAQRFHRSVCAFAALLIFSAAAFAESKFSFDSTPGQIPKDVVPKDYSIAIQVDMKALTFKGTESVQVEVRKAGNTIVLNQADLRISRAGLTDGSGQIASIKLDDKDQIVTLTFPQVVPVGVHKLEIAFEGKIGDQAQGLYYVEYPTEHGKKIMLTTQMEPTDARRMFPCWDEPVYRSTYQLTVTTPGNMMAVSNTSIETEKSAGAGVKTITFGRTPKMSSYLVVLVVGELEAVTGQTDGVQLRVITTQGKKESGRYALAALEKLIPYYNDYFGIKYPLPKLDLIAIPGGFSGAMENWGGITFEESELLFDPETSSEDTKADIFSTLAHEVAHQWFGDLVTMAWWNNLWLNEGFASWMGTKATDHFNPQWSVWLRENPYKNSVMRFDARKTTHPIQQTVNSPAEANRIFDEITYGKGEAFLRMLESYVGETPFRDGIRVYMRTHQYSNTTTADLWEALGDESGKPVSEIASGWTEQPGFPLVSAKSTCKGDQRMLTLEQQRFTINDPEAQPLLWRIPISLESAPGRPASYLLINDKFLSVAAGECKSPVKLNAGNIGYFRVKYEPQMFDGLIRSVRELPVDDKLNLLSDTWALAEAAQGPATSYLDLVEALRNETNLALWEEILDHLELIDNLEVGRSEREHFRSYARSLLASVFLRVGWDAKSGEDHAAGLLRNRLIRALGRFKDPGVTSEAERRFNLFLRNPKSLNPDLRASVFYVVGRYSNQAAYDQLRKLGRMAQSTEEKQQFYDAMMGALDPKLAQQNLQIALSNELPNEMAAYSLFTVASSGEHTEDAVRFAREHLKELSGKLPSGTSISYIPNLFSVFSDAERADELESFSKRNLSPEAQPDVAKAAESIRSKSSFKRRELPRIEE